MIDARSIRRWYLVHKWTSLVCTLFLLLLCITGLPLIFYEEMEDLLGYAPEPPEHVDPAARADLDGIAAAARALTPGKPLRFLIWDEHKPVVFTSASPRPDSPPEEFDVFAFDQRTGQQLDIPRFDEGIMFFLFRLHTDMFAGLPGMLFLGFMGLLFVVAIVSGVVVYGPFMRKLPFGTVRTGRSARLQWLDLHNLLGIVTLVWAAAVGLTGTVNTLAQPILLLWQADQLAEMTAPYRDLPPLTDHGSVQAAVDVARAAAPEMTPSFVAFPGSGYSSNHHFAVFMHGATPLSERLLKPALVDVRTSELTAMRDLPWYVAVLLISQPLHFGDYGGMPLKVLWAILDVITIVVLVSGLYLWLGRRRVPVEARLAEIESGGLDLVMARGGGPA